MAHPGGTLEGVASSSSKSKFGASAPIGRPPSTLGGQADDSPPFCSSFKCFYKDSQTFTKISEGGGETKILKRQFDMNSKNSSCVTNNNNLIKCCVDCDSFPSCVNSTEIHSQISLENCFSTFDEKVMRSRFLCTSVESCSKGQHRKGVQSSFENRCGVMNFCPASQEVRPSMSKSIQHPSMDLGDPRTLGHCSFSQPSSFQEKSSDPEALPSKDNPSMSPPKGYRGTDCAPPSYFSGSFSYFYNFWLGLLVMILKSAAAAQYLQFFWASVIPSARSNPRRKSFFPLVLSTIALSSLFALPSVNGEQGELQWKFIFLIFFNFFFL